ncbi:putative integral membrane protein [Rosellinia necatrix]|uniref:Putative integral membrane protein n=1 Tax=Rosellinia necatrix TaxID=77044 RepID=A0A1W2TH10_ROSNE|nr:putative integral membrane protein [Rosellinia necatrix]
MRWAGEITYVATGISLKLTVGIFLLRICSRKWHKITIYTVLVVCVGFNTFYIFMAAFQCRPVEYFWERYTNNAMAGSCFPGRLVTGLTYAACSINAVGDWILGLLPIVLVRDLNLVKRQKISVAVILALGAVASTATIVRLFYVWQLAHDDDTLYKFTDLAIWSTVENGLGLTASSIATLRPLFKSFLGVARSHRLSTNRNVLRKRSRNTNSYGPGPSPGADSQFYGLEARPPNRTASAEFGQCSDDGSNDGTPTNPSKYSWQSYDSYEMNKDVLTRHYYPIHPREARTRWHSDGSRHYRTGGHAHESQRGYSMHTRQLSA